jgi:hypothetical protein
MLVEEKRTLSIIAEISVRRTLVDDTLWPFLVVQYVIFVAVDVS